MPGVTIRPLATSDRVQWDELWCGFLEFTDTILPESVTDKTWHRLIATNEQPSALAAFDEDGLMLGFAHFLFHRTSWGIGPVCYLEDLFVTEQARGLGAGRALVLDVERTARENGCEEMYLVTAKDNEIACGLYNQVMDATSFIEYRKSLA